MRRRGADLDDVLVGFMDKFLLFHNAKNSTNWKQEDFRTPHITKTLEVSVEEAERFLNDFYESPVFLDIELEEGAAEMVEELSSDGLLYIITSRPTHTKAITEYQIEQLFPNWPFAGLHFAGYHDGMKSKMEIAENLELDAFIDDIHLNLLNGNERPPTRTFLRTRPWNEDVDESEFYAERVDSLAEFVESVKTN